MAALSVRRKPMLAYPKPPYYLKPFDQGVLERVAEIPWLSRAGQPMPDSAVCHITEKHEAVRLITAPEWDDFRLEMRNEMTGFLAKQWSQNYTEFGLLLNIPPTHAIAIQEKS